MAQSEFDLGWLTGIIEGEGCLSARVGYDKRDDRQRVCLRVNITSSSVPIKDNILRIFSSMGVECSVQVRKPKNTTWKDVYHIDVQSHKSILRVLLPILLHLKSGKKNIANAMISYIRTRHDNRGAYSDEDIYLANRIRAMCDTHNIKKGTKMGGDLHG